MKLYMMMLGSMPPGRNTEQHDVFFGIGSGLKELVPAINEFWPEAYPKIHIDAWREVNQVGKYEVEIMLKTDSVPAPGVIYPRLFFINLGGYKAGEFEEFHYRLLIAAMNKGEAIKEAKQTAFYRHCGFKGATSHVDDKYGIDVDDFYEITDVLPAAMRDKYTVVLTETNKREQDAINLGYFKLDKLTW